MSFSETTQQLEQSFRRTAVLLQNLLDGLKARRAAWGSARPRVIVPSPELEQEAKDLAREESLRADLTKAIGKALPQPMGASASTLHVNVTRIAAALPDAAARSLQQAADVATSLAKQVRVEVTLGQRLLRFTQNAQQHLHGRLGGPAARSQGAASYDRHARRHSALVATNAGTLIDGRM